MFSAQSTARDDTDCLELSQPLGLTDSFEPSQPIGMTLTVLSQSTARDDTDSFEPSQPLGMTLTALSPVNR